jgi:hypothetical protein
MRGTKQAATVLAYHQVPGACGEAFSKLLESRSIKTLAGGFRVRDHVNVPVQAFPIEPLTAECELIGDAAFVLFGRSNTAHTSRCEGGGAAELRSAQRAPSPVCRRPRRGIVDRRTPLGYHCGEGVLKLC